MAAKVYKCIILVIILVCVCVCIGEETIKVKYFCNFLSLTNQKKKQEIFPFYGLDVLSLFHGKLQDKGR